MVSVRSAIDPGAMQGERAPREHPMLPAVLELALGRRSVEILEQDWSPVFDLAARERVAVLAWLRSGSRIRSDAPPSIVQRWRALALAADELARVQLRAMAEIVDALSSMGLAPVVLKGPPLACRLYGDPSVRQCTDLDLYVDSRARIPARETLLRAGWQRVDSADCWEDGLAAAREGWMIFVELHSSLVGQNLYHLAVPAPIAVVTRVGDVVLPVHDDSFVPGYLAAHLAKHRRPPLLWWIDLAQLWSISSGSARSAAIASAQAAGLDRYLEWGLNHAQELGGAGHARVSPASGASPRQPADSHVIFRDVRLAPTRLDAVRAVGAWLWPPVLRGDHRRFATLCARRLRRMMPFAASREARGLPQAPAAASQHRFMDSCAPERRKAPRS